MNNAPQFKEQYDESNSSRDLTSASIREQLIWSSFFPLAIFGLLSTLVISNVFYKFSLELVTQRNLAQIQSLALSIDKEILNEVPVQLIDLHEFLNVDDNQKIQSLYIIDSQGLLLNKYEEINKPVLTSFEDIISTTDLENPISNLMQSPLTGEEIMISMAQIPDTDYTIALLEPWIGFIKPVVNYQILLSVISLSGVLLSLTMLFMAINRITRPIAMLTMNANNAIPGSIFHPVKEFGPKEIRILINAFNKMVIRLAEQQQSLRRLTHKALLSQEEERQRLSHELHDGTLQDLVGLSQRVELFRNEIKTNGNAATERLVEIESLLNHTLDDVRNISIALRPPLLDELGLDVAIESLCKKMTQSKPGIKCNFQVNGYTRRLDPDLELTVYRVIQEALSNIRKHAPNTTLVHIELFFNDKEIKAVITNNNAQPFDNDIQDYVRNGHIGLAGMYERARLFGGNLDIKSIPTKETVISIQLPYINEPEIN